MGTGAARRRVPQATHFSLPIFPQVWDQQEGTSCRRGNRRLHWSVTGHGYPHYFCSRSPSPVHSRENFEVTGHRCDQRTTECSDLTVTGEAPAVHCSPARKLPAALKQEKWVTIDSDRGVHGTICPSEVRRSRSG